MPMTSGIVMSMTDAETRPSAIINSSARREWGHDRRTEPLAVTPRPASDRHVAMSRLGIVATVIAWVAYTVWWMFNDLFGDKANTAVARTETIAYLLIVTVLTASSLAYLLARLGHLNRTRTHHRASRADLDAFYDESTPSMTVIVPSYQENANVIRKTLLSAALQEYPDMWVVLLIDDPPKPKSHRARALLADARDVPAEVTELLAAPATRFASALREFEASPDSIGDVTPKRLAMLATEYGAAVDWLEDLAASEPIEDHTDAFFADHVVRRLAGDLRTTGQAIERAASEGATLPARRVRQLYRRLAWIFDAELSSFERKRYVSLSHEPNKAMNLNSFLGLMGGRYREVMTPGGLALERVTIGSADISIPDPDFVLTLDADSVLLPEYCLRLVHLLEQREQARTAIAQTPYSAFPGSATRLERIAGATTDLQHIVHQGLTTYDATFWVGANAVIRKRALDDIAVKSYVGDFEITTYIKDLTVIEDTESTIDLAAAGWSLFNYPERLSYSATPPDFGSLCIQRRRWANGGLLLIPKLHRKNKLQRQRGERPRFGETFLRWNYMSSVATSSLALIVLLGFPFDATLISPLLGLIALPYFVAMAADLRACGYKRLDIFRIYGFNLLLVPVNLAGMTSSLTQAITASRSAFARTPKVKNRTVAPLGFLVMPLLMTALAAYTVVHAWHHHLIVNLAYAVLNITLVLYAIVAFIGVRNTVTDVWVHTKAFLYRPVSPSKRAVATPASAPLDVDWRSVLQAGSADPDFWPKSKVSGLRVEDGRVEETAVSHEITHRFHTVFQPVFELGGDSIVGFEALTRFDEGPQTQQRLAEALAVGDIVNFEATIAHAALQAATALPPDTWLAVKASGRALTTDEQFIALFDDTHRSIVVEVSEPTLRDVRFHVAQLREELPSGVRIAIDHAGLDYSTLRLVDELRPWFVKVDRRHLVGIATDPVLQAQVRVMTALATQVGTMVLASGVETETDLDVLRSLGVHLAQGYLLGRPTEPIRAQA